jgi:thiamine-monophosphate kinase
MSGEFDLIARHFCPLAAPEALSLLDDAALLPVSGTLALTADAMVAGVHFLPNDPADLVARKLLRVNLSDLAAMSAEPVGYLVTMAVPYGTEEAWFAAFAGGLAADQAEFGVRLLGGDTTATPGPLTLSLTALGRVTTPLRRQGAQPGDGLFVTGTIGDAALGLLALQGKLADPTGTLVERYRLPRPRLGLRLGEIAHAGLDVSDGLVQDVGHLCACSGVAAVIEAALVPLSAAARAAGAKLETILTGGDDYELAIALPPGAEALLPGGVAFTRIGQFEAGPPAVRVVDAQNQPVPLERAGWQHFR